MDNSYTRVIRTQFALRSAVRVRTSRAPQPTKRFRLDWCHRRLPRLVRATGPLSSLNRAPLAGSRSPSAGHLAHQLWLEAQVRTFVDNDLSAADPAVARSQWQALLDSRGIASVHTVREGERDVAEGGGRMVSRIMAAVDAEYAEVTRVRIRRALRQLAAEGRPNGGRVFGYVSAVGEDGRKTRAVAPQRPRPSAGRQPNCSEARPWHRWPGPSRPRAWPMCPAVRNGRGSPRVGGCACGGFLNPGATRHRLGDDPTRRSTSSNPSNTPASSPVLDRPAEHPTADAKSLAGVMTYEGFACL